MNKHIYLLSIGLLLVACTPKEKQVLNETVKVSDEITGTQSEENFNEISKAFDIVKEYSGYVNSETYGKSIDEIMEASKLGDKELQEFVRTEEYINYNLLDDERLNKIENHKKELLKIFKDKLTSKIENGVLQSFSDDIRFGYFGEDEELQAIYWYKDALKAKEKEKSLPIYKLYSNVSPTYSGKYSKEIQNIVKENSSMVLWEENYHQRAVEKKPRQPKQPKQPKPSPSIKMAEPFIGMTDYEVLKSTWGRPSKINKTESINGIREQWVYSNGYLYFEDHYLVSIQSSR